MIARLTKLIPTVLLASAVLVPVACSSEEDAGENCAEATEGEATGAVCPPTTTLTYENFGAPFMEKYCTNCHSSTKTGEARHCAPADHDFDTLDGVLEVAEHIDEYAAGGPDGTNAAMPPSGPKPTDDERKQLGEWLACELAASDDGGLPADGGAD